MRKKRSSSLTIHAKQWMYSLTLVMLVGLGMALFIMSKNNSTASQWLRAQVMEIVVPVVSVVSAPLDALRSGVEWVRDIAALHTQNLQLKQENAELLKWQTAAKEMQAENEALKRLLNVAQVPSRSFVTARMVTDVGGPYVHSALVQAGSDQLVQQQQAVVTEQGLIGRTIEVSHSAARVLLLGDINSRVPVMGEKTREKAILAGASRANMPVLTYLPANSEIAVGERLVTSGDGGVFPAGIPVGEVVRIDQGQVVVQPFATPHAAEYVTIVGEASH